MRVFYIEDDQEDRYLFEDALKLVNYKIEFEAAAGYEEALFKLKTGKPPALIFLDITMPIRSGIDCLKTIKANPLLSGIPVIIYSASNDLKDVTECMRLGAAKYLVKPNDLETLCAELRALL
ncbi:response regulator [Fulvivirgaceae bacterium PWU4]|uniref:Response regulator n=1 Tax=Chryseosolibacter histidini TaxID=2782349 RepID=A0AAP2DSR9_9BACT|nr:response regulator [Chryseosolibacter histidini]MBT1700377.1 response regulator [Chryseosolibacter histidini]